MTRRPRPCRELRRSETAGTLAEHSLMLALVALACLAAVQALGGAVEGLLRRALLGFGGS